jgi:class 3 adenylate cyclase
MKTDLFKKVNWKTTLILGLMLAVLFINGITGLYSLYRSHVLATYYGRAASRVKDVHIMFQKQSQMWKNMLLDSNRSSAGRASEYGEFYYQFSRYSSKVQDALFNLKTELSDDIQFSRSLQELRKIHGSLSNQYAAQVFRMYQSGGPGLDPAAVMREPEEMAMSRMEKITGEIQNVAEAEMENSFRNYFILAFASVGLLMIVSAAMVVYILLINRRMQRHMMDVADRLNSYLPPQFVRSVLVGDTDTEGLINRKPLTVCFTDLQGFTAITEKHPPEITARILNEYFTDMTTIAHAWGGVVDKFIGDGIMILFGVLEDVNEYDQADNCVHMALAMQGHMSLLRDRWRDGGLDDSVRLRIGVHSGVATVGTFGPADRRAFTAIGTTVNIASRLEKLCIADGILISEATKILLDDGLVCKPVGPQQIRGLSEMMELFQVQIEDDHAAAAPVLSGSLSASPTRT